MTQAQLAQVSVMLSTNVGWSGGDCQLMTFCAAANK